MSEATATKPRARPYSKRKYGSPFEYESKLERVAKRLGITVARSAYGWTGEDAWVEFDYHGSHYRFHHSVANSCGQHKLTHGSDCFCQIVLTLEDIARMVERRIYDLSVYVAGMKALPLPQDIPAPFRAMGFTGIVSADKIESRYRDLARKAHPDTGGSQHEMQQLNLWREQCLGYLTVQRRRAGGA